MEDQTNKPKISSDMVFNRVVELMKGSVDLQQRINAHIHAKHGHPHIVSFHNNGATEEVRLQTYAECLKALKTRDFGALQGQVAKAQASMPVQSEPAAPAVVEQEEVVEEKAEELKQPEPATAPPKPGSLEAIIAAAIAPFISAQSGKADPKEIKDTVRMEVNKRIGDVQNALNEYASKRITSYLESLPARDTFEIRQGEEIRQVDGVYHWQLPQLAAWVSADIPLWLWGKAGGGKTSLNDQIAAAVGLEPFTFSIDPTVTIGKMVGYRNLATGEFVQGWLYRPFKEGGCVMLDELDTGDPGVIAGLNALLANKYYTFPNNERVERHPKFRVIVGANTKGAGAVAGYSARNKLDAATLDRFAVIELEYDQDMELAISIGEPKAKSKQWKQGTPASKDACRTYVEWVQNVRSKVANAVLISPRASLLGCRALRAGIPAKEVCEALVFKLCTSDTIESIKQQCGEFVV